MDIQKLIEEVKAMSVVELNDLVKALEEEFGVSAAAPVAVAGAGCTRRRRKDRIQHRAQRYRRKQDRRDQSGTRIHGSRTCGSKESSREPRRFERSGSQGGRRCCDRETERSRRNRRIAIIAIRKAVYAKRFA